MCGIQPQIKAPRIAPMEGAHTYVLAYVDFLDADVVVSSAIRREFYLNMSQIGDEFDYAEYPRN